jgi:hypothetical protein
LCSTYGEDAAQENKNQEIDMLKKTTASVGLAVAASAGVLLFTGSPASAQTISASAQTPTAYVQTTGTSTGRHWKDHRDDSWGHHSARYWDEYWRHHRHHRHSHHHGWKQNHSDNAATHQVVISRSTTKVSVGG